MDISKAYLSKIFIVIFHVVGFVGFVLPDTREFFITLVPYHLLLMAGILVANFAKFTPKMFYVVAIIIFAGFIIEVIGVRTGKIFGHYFYGNTLGFKLFSVPLIIGINWFIVVFMVAGTLRSWLKKQKVLRTLLGALLLVVMDYLIEPVAVKFDYWAWQNNIIPVQNYMGWFVVSLLMMVFYNYFDFKKRNNVVKVMLISQLLFFVALNIFTI
ncbi:MAG: carotenoid biosynthesis protein [Sphingobacteriales bacterium]|nr:MAG: carotenoid biosynthesis protein [Sphingobacteriales bacterium]TAF81754.1 MAG: carotenoid biosynthesis protein [Sphingobacteriales bacterium]